jgi:hypothetical protein
MTTINNAYDAYWFLYHHPKSVNVDPKHPLVDTSEYEHPGIKGLTSARSGKKRDTEFKKAFAEHRTTMEWKGQFIYNLDIHYAKVDPETRRIEDDQSKNTVIEVWLETGPAMWEDLANQYISNTHDTSLDCGGPTFDEALIVLANKVKEKYGDYEHE